MKKLLKTFLLAVCLLVGGTNSAWAYDLPDGTAIKSVFVGTNNGDGTVSPDAFDYTSLPTAWTSQTGAVLSLGNKTFVDNVAVGSIPEAEPTYVNGKTLQLTVSGTNWDYHYGRYTLSDAISTGYLVFRADMFCANSPTYVRFLDESGNELLRLGFNNGSGDKYYQFAVNGGSASNSNMHTNYRSYHGFALEDLVLNMQTGAVSFTLDYIDTNNSNKHAQVANTKNINIGTDKKIKYLELGSVVNSSQTVHFDNIAFYHVENDYTVKAMAGETELQILATGSVAEGAEYSVSGLSRVIQKNGVYYVLDGDFKQTFTRGSGQFEVKTVSYTADPSIVYFTETEAKVGSQNETGENYSGGKTVGYHNTRYSIGTYAAGSYQLETNVTGRASNSDLGVYFGDSESMSATIEKNGGTGIRTVYFTVPANDTEVKVGNIYNSLSYDYVLIRKAYQYSINAVSGETTLSTLASGYCLEGDDYDKYVPKAVKYNDQYYFLDDADNTNLSTYHASYTMGNSDEVKEINYTLKDEVIYYAEYEDICGAVASYTYFEAQSSKGFSKALYGSNVMKTAMGLASQGIYDVILAGGNRYGNNTANPNLKLIDSEEQVSESAVISTSIDKSTWKGEMTATNVTVPAGSEFYIANDNGEGTSKFVGDYIYVAKSKVAYTVEYKCGATTLKTADATRTAIWGTKVALTAADKEDIANADLGTYEYASDDADDVTIAMDGSSVITVQFTAKSISYTVKAVDQSDNELTTLASGDATADGSTEAYWSKYIKVGGQWYETVDATYGKAIKVANNTVTYKASKISYFNEGEAMTGYSAAATLTGETYSGGVSGRHRGNTSWTTTEGVAAGSYIISFPYKNQNTSASTVSVYEVKSDNSETLIEDVTMSTPGTFTKYNVELAEGSKLRITKGDNNSNWCIDYVTLTKLYDQTTVTGAQTWDWTVVNASDKAYGGLTDDTFIKKNSEILLKNVEIYGKMDGSGYTIIDGFGDAQKLLVKAEHPFRYENGKGGYFQGTTVKFTTEVPGTLTVKFSNTGSSNTRELYVNDEATDFTSTSTEMVTASDIEVSAGEVVITAKATEDLTKLAYIRISQITFTPTGVKATIGAYGYATFSSIYPLDFSSVTELKAYKATESDGDEVTMERIEGTVAANTGLVVKGSTAIIPIVNEGDVHSDNMLYACDGSWTTLNKSNTGTNYVLSVQSGYVVFAPINSKPATLRAGTAYLYVPDAGSRALRISFDDLDSETTAISEELRVKNGEKANAPVYNMQGQRVENPQKGLYISGGKKYFVK